MRKLADAHLVYIDAGPRSFDVYPSAGSRVRQLGRVYSSVSRQWTAIEDGPPRRVAVERTRWEAATRLWGADQ